MLVLSRKLNEGIRIGDEIRIVVVKVERNGVRIGIEAPGHVGIVREELLPGVTEDAPAFACPAKN